MRPTTITTFVGVALGLMCNSSVAEIVNGYRLGAETLVSGTSLEPAAEVSIATSTVSASRAVAAWMYTPSAGLDAKLGFSVRNTNGTWTANAVPFPGSWTVGTSLDPTTVSHGIAGGIDTWGLLVGGVVSLTPVGSRVFSAKVTNGGGTPTLDAFNLIADADFLCDKPLFAAGPRDGSLTDKDIYAIWTSLAGSSADQYQMYWSRSTNVGTSWDAQRALKIISTDTRAVLGLAAAPLIIPWAISGQSSNARVLVLYMTACTGCGDNRRYLRVLRSDDPTATAPAAAWALADDNLSRFISPWYYSGGPR